MKTSMKSLAWACGLFTLIFSAYCPVSLSASAATEKSAKAEQGYKKIDAKELKQWMDSGKKIEIIDARPKKFEDGAKIVGAKLLPYDSDEAAITKALPSKESTIVVYCASTKCPASTYLSQQLVSMGYTHVYKYPGGIADWIDKKYPTR